MEHLIILADGDFPTHALPLAALHAADRLICCDGAVFKLMRCGWQPSKSQAVEVIGDGDSTTAAQRAALPYPFHVVSEQADNDLTKAFNLALHTTSGKLEITILGATGLREDHTIGNLGHLMQFHLQLLEERPGSSVRIVSDYGTFTPLHGYGEFASFPRQQVSLFAFSSDEPITTTGLQYPMNSQCIRWQWEATLNAALADRFTVSGGDLLVYQTHEPKN